jgi:hypothetical protein
MKLMMLFCIAGLSLAACSKKNEEKEQGRCDMQKVYSQNAKKLTITSGVWGTVSLLEGNCMPMIDPANTTCKQCPVKRTVKIYEYTLQTQATPSPNKATYFESFSTKLVAQAETDSNGFFQLNIPSGHYTMAIVENGKLYANGTDGQGGLNPVTYSSGTQLVNQTVIKAVF